MDPKEQQRKSAKKIVQGMSQDGANLERALGLLTASGDVVSDLVTATEVLKRLNVKIEPEQLRTYTDAIVAEIEIFQKLDAVGQQAYLSALAESEETQ